MTSLTSYRAAIRYAPADRGRSTSVRGRIRSPHTSGGLQGSCGAAGLGAARLAGQGAARLGIAVARLGQVGQTDGQTNGSRYRLMPAYGGGIIIQVEQSDGCVSCS